MSTPPTSMSLRQRVWALAEPVCRHAGYDLVDVRFILEQGGWVLRVFIDVLPEPEPVPAFAPGAADINAVDPEAVDPDAGLGPAELVDLNDCERMSRELSAVLDVEDFIPHAYSLEVSSPGIDRPLVTVEHFRRFIGAELKATLDRGLATGTAGSERKNFRGVLESVEGDGDAAVAVIVLDGQPWRLPIADIDVARIIPDWDAVMRGERGQIRPPSKPPASSGKRGPSAPTSSGKPTRSPRN